MRKDGHRDFCGRKALNLQIFTVAYLKFVDRKHLHTTLCSAGYGASTVVRKLARRLSVSGIATPLTNCSVKTSGSSKEMGAIYNQEGNIILKLSQQQNSVKCCCWWLGSTQPPTTP
jgi:hypothetical protein